MQHLPYLLAASLLLSAATASAQDERKDKDQKKHYKEKNKGY